MLGYILIGVAWSAWLEWYSTSQLDYPYNSPWTIKERLFHILLWVVSFSVFTDRPKVTGFRPKNKSTQASKSLCCLPVRR
jgi:hypothetical protein